MTKTEHNRLLAIRNTTHGMSSSPEYNSYNAMKQRCYYARHKDYPQYGGRGIRVCERWLQGFEFFFRDVGRRPTINHSIDRIDPDGDYTPKNTRWANKFEQSRTRRNTIRVVLPSGANVTLKQAAEHFGANYGSARYAVHECGEEPLEACIRLGAGKFKKTGPGPRRRNQ